MCRRNVLGIPGVLWTVTATAIALSSAPAAPPSPAVAAEGEASPEVVLRGKGLKREGAFFVLESEAVLRTKQAALRRGLREWEPLRARVELLRRAVAEKRAEVERLERQRRDLAAAAASRSAPANAARPSGFPGMPMPGPPPEMGGPPGMPMPGPPPRMGGPPGEGPPGPFDPGRRDREAHNAQARAQKLDAQRVQILHALVLDRVLLDRLSALARQKKGEIRRRSDSARSLLDATNRRYGELAGDSEVGHALAEINKEADPRVSLGPSHDLKAEAVPDTSAFRDDRAEDVGTDPLAGVDDARTLASLTDSFQQGLAAELATRQSRQSDAQLRRKRLRDAQASEARLAAEAKRGDARDKEKINLQWKGARDQIRRLQNEADREGRELEDDLEQIATLRVAFVKCVGALEAAMERANPLPGPGAGDETAKAKAKESTGDGREKADAQPQASPPATREQRALLARVKDLLDSRTIPLELDRTALWAVATLNGKPDHTAVLKMVLDPFAEMTLLPSRTAAELGVERDEGAADVPVVAPDGSTLSAAPARLATVEVGPCRAADVDCLILPEGYGAPAVLGASFLDHFVARVDPDAATLTLVRVDVKPHAGKPTTRTGAGAKAKEKKPQAR